MPVAPRLSLRLLLCLGVLLPVADAPAHSPHDDILALAASPEFETDGFVLAVVRHSYFGAVLVSRDGGRSFTPAGRGIPTSLVEHLAVSPRFSEDRTAWAVTRRGVLYETSDAALRWRRVEGWPEGKLSPVGDMTAFLLPSGSGTDASIPEDSASPALLVGHEDGTLRIGRVVDGTWRPVFEIDVGGGAVEAVVALEGAGSAVVLLAGTAEGSLLRWSLAESDAGWVAIDLPGSGAVASLVSSVGPEGQMRLYALRDLETGSRDQSAGAGRPAVSSEESLIQGGRQRPFLPMTTRLFTSEDGGASWTELESLRRWIVDSVAVVPGEGRRPWLLVGTRGAGLVLGDPGVGHWKTVSGGFDPPSPQSSGEHYRYLITGDSGRVVLAGTFEGLYRSEDSGRTWRQSPVLPSSIVSDVAFSPGFRRDGLLWTSRYGSGLMRYRLGAAAWEWSAEGLPDVFLYMVRALRGAGGATDLLALGARYLHRSSDGGETWSVFLGTSYASSVDASPDYAESGRLAVGDRVQGPALSSDRGASWRALDAGASPGSGRTTRDHVSGLRYAPDDPSGRAMVLTTWRNGLFRSDDGGASWRSLPSSPRAIRSLGISPGFAADGFALVSTLGGRTLVTGDGGATWSEAGTGLPPGSVRAWLILPEAGGARRVLAGTASEGVWLSEDGGATFLPSRGPSTAITSLALSPGSGMERLVAAGTHQGLLLSRDLGASFRSVPEPRVILPMDQTLRYEGEWEINFHRAVPDVETRRALALRPGSAVEVEVEGRAFTVIGGRAPGFGTLAVLLDGEETARVDLRAESPSSGERLHRGELSPGRHDLRLELRPAPGGPAPPPGSAPAGALSLERLEVERAPFAWDLMN